MIERWGEDDWPDTCAHCGLPTERGKRSITPTSRYVHFPRCPAVLPPGPVAIQPSLRLPEEPC